MIKKITTSLLMANIILATNLLAAEEKVKDTSNVKIVPTSVLENVTFFKNPNIEVKEVDDRGV
jgi:hypothetical protein